MTRIRQSWPPCAASRASLRARCRGAERWGASFGAAIPDRLKPPVAIEVRFSIQLCIARAHAHSALLVTLLWLSWLRRPLEQPIADSATGMASAIGSSRAGAPGRLADYRRDCAEYGVAPRSRNAGEGYGEGECSLHPDGLRQAKWRRLSGVCPGVPTFVDATAGAEYPGYEGSRPAGCRSQNG